MTAALPLFLIAGLMTLSAFFLGKGMKFIKLPGLIGFMICGVLLGPSALNLLSESAQDSLSFLTSLALGFVALTIGLELKFSTLKKQGSAILWIIFTESFMAFLLVTGMVYLLTRNLPLALIFGSIAPASAPAGTVAVIQENKARGPLTSALYSVVGFDDGLGIIIFGFASALAKDLLLHDAGQNSGGGFLMMIEPLKEIILCLVVGAASGMIFNLLTRWIKKKNDLFILITGILMVNIGLCAWLHLSLILTNMTLGLLLVNTQSSDLIRKISDQLRDLMPLLFVLFFCLAGSNLHLAALPTLGLLGGVYILSRTAGLMGGAFLGSIIGRAEPVIRKYLGLGILSQAGVAIGLALIVKQEFGAISPAGAELGSTVITTVTATCIFFEIIGPILTKVGLTHAKEIQKR